jgi:hypothetical protein
MAHDYRNSTAQLSVDFLTGIEVTTNPGDNYMQTLIFIDKNPAYVIDENAFISIDKDQYDVVLHDIAVLNKNNYAEIVGGRLLTHITDLFCNGEPFNCYVIRFGPSGGIGSAAAFTEDVQADLNDIYEKTKAIAYHKTILCQSSDDGKLIPEIALFFARCCGRDSSLLSAAPYYPCFMETIGDLTSDPVYTLLKTAGADAFMTAHADTERNGALFQLGLALNGLNASGTPVGDSIDMVATSLITPSGHPDPDTPDFVINDWEDYNLSAGVQKLLEDNHICYFRTVGDSTGRVSAIGDTTIRNEVMQAKWVVNFCNFVNKVRTAQIITRKNVRRNARTYNEILTVMMGTINRFGDIGSGILTRIVNSAPSFDTLPPSGGREIIVPNAWSADYVFGVRTVRVYGTLIIAA